MMKNANGFDKRFKPQKKKEKPNKVAFDYDLKKGEPRMFNKARELSIIDKKTGDIKVLIETRDIKAVKKVAKNLEEFFGRKQFRSRYIVCWLEIHEDVQSKWLEVETVQYQNISMYRKQNGSSDL